MEILKYTKIQMLKAYGKQQDNNNNNTNTYGSHNMTQEKLTSSNLEERKETIQKLKDKYPELEINLGWYNVCRSISLCRNKKMPKTMDDELTQLLKRTEIELENLTSTTENYVEGK